VVCSERPVPTGGADVRERFAPTRAALTPCAPGAVQDLRLRSARQFR